MTISKKGKGPGHKGPPRPVAASSELMAVTSRKLSDEDFTRWFNLLLDAVSHECGNLLLSLERRVRDAGEEHSHIYRDAAMYFRALNMLTNALPQKAEKTKPEILETLTGFRSALLEAKNYLVEGEQQKRFEMALTYGIMLSDCIEKLVADDFSFSAVTLPMNVCGKDSMAEKLEHAAKPSGCSYSTVEMSMLEGAQVVSNPIFSTLIFANLLSNAKRAAEEAGREPDITVSVRKTGDWVDFDVRDNGGGMAPETMMALNAGERVTTKTEEGAHGLGFRYCRELAQEMGGDLFIGKTGPTGTTAVLRLRTA